MVKTQGLLTIVVPCYNGEKYIKRCTASLEGLQDDISILFINDGSTDSSPLFIENWISTRKNAFLVTKPNGGYATAINCALDSCGSEYVMFLGVDDELAAESIHQVVERLKLNNPDILAFTTVKCFDDLEGEQAQEKDPGTVYSCNGFFETDLFSLYNEKPEDAAILFERDTSRCFKMSCIGDIRYFGKVGVSADGCFSTLVACNAASFEFLNVDGYIWHLHSDSVSSRKKTKKSMMDEVCVWDAFFTYLQQHIDGTIPFPIIYYAYIYGEVAYALSKEDKEFARSHIKRSREIAHWLFKRPLPLGWRLKLQFPGMYRLWLCLRKKL